jgi:hypothetical protein
VEAPKTDYVTPGTTLRRARGAGKSDGGECRVGALPSGENILTLQKGDLLTLTRGLKPGRPTIFDNAGKP